MVAKGSLKKMEVSVYEGNQINYSLFLSGKAINMNTLLGKYIELKYSGTINCISCGTKTKKSYAQGYCYSCMQTVPEADDCVLRPLLCRAHLGISRDPEWAKSHCLQPHYVYLANTGDVKVGVTRESQIPTRWIDQGATSAIKLCKTPNRHIAGLIESFLSGGFSDKTQWKKMVSGKVDLSIDLLEQREKAVLLLPGELARYNCNENKIYEFQYPVIEYPQSPKTVSFDSENIVKGKLNGIKGQYLLIDNNIAINIRKHTGYLIELTC